MNGTSVTVVGNVASDLTVRRAGAQEAVVVGFRIIANERKWDKIAGAYVDGERFSARVSCWRRLGEHVRSSLMKGDPVVVCGKVSVREYEVDGGRRYSTEIEASAVGPDLTHCRAVVSRRTRADEEGTEEGTEEGAEQVVATAVPGVPGSPPHPAERGDAPDDEDTEDGPDPDLMPAVA